MRQILFRLLACCALSGTAWAETATLTWTANPEPDLKGYKLYRGLGVCPTADLMPLLGTLLKVTTYTDSLIPAGTTEACYRITAYDTSNNESSKSAAVSKTFVVTPPVVAPGTPVVTIGAVAATSLTVSLAPVDDGAGGTAMLEVRYAVAPALTNFGWGSASSAACPAFPCVIPGLSSSTMYEVQAVAWRTVSGVNAYGPLSAVVAGTTLLPPDVTPPVTPGGLKVVSATPTEVIIVARVLDCPRLVTSTAGSTAAVTKRTVRCVP